MRSIPAGFVVSGVLLTCIPLRADYVVTDTTTNFSPIQGAYNPSGVTPGSSGGADPGAVTATPGAPGTYTYGWYQFPESSTVPSTANPKASGTFVPYAAGETNGTDTYSGPYSYQNGGGFPFVYNNSTEHGITSSNAGYSGTTTNVPAGAAIAPTKVWVSNYSGVVTISGSFQSQNTCCGAAETPDVYVNGTLYQNVDGLQPVGTGNGEADALHTYSIANVVLHAGDVVEWVMDPGNNFFGNSNLLSGTVTATPEPASIAVLSLGVMGVLAFRRRRIS